MGKSMNHFNLKEILAKAHAHKFLSFDEIIFLLGLSNESDIRLLFEASRTLRYKYFQNKVFLYGFVYFSTWCTNECTFCSYRYSNSLSKRYRKSNDEIWETIWKLKESGVHLIDLTMGEDPIYHHKVQGFEPIIDLVKEIKSECNLPVMISPGVLSWEDLKRFFKAGADWYACYQETFNKELFTNLRVRQSFERRLQSKYLAAKAGLLVEEGLLLGVGESTEDIAASFEFMRHIAAQQVRVMSFIPQVGTPLENRVSPDRIMEYKAIAVLRLLFPDRLIPASLDVDGIDGLDVRLTAGANVVTSIIPPRSGLAGVAQCNMDIDDGYRTVQGVLPILKKNNLEVAGFGEYINWIKLYKNKFLVSKAEAVGELYGNSSCWGQTSGS